MNISWPNRVAGKAVRRGAARAGIVGIAALTVAGAVALTAPAMSAMAAPLNATTTVVTNPFPITEPADTPATVDVQVTDDTADGPAPTGTVLVTTDVPWADNAGLPPGVVYECTADLTPAAGLLDGLAYSTGSCATGGVGWGFIEVGAIYSGDDANATSNTDGTEVKIINLMPTTTTVTAPAATAGHGVTVVATLNANVLSAYPEVEYGGPPNPDTITFTVTDAADAVVATCDVVPLVATTGDTPNYADCAVPGTLAAGTYTVTAAFAGDEYAAGSTGTGTLTVAPPVKSATTTTMSGASGYVGSQITLAAKVAGGAAATGTVEFVWDGKTLCAAGLSNGAAHCTHAFSAVGARKIEAVYEGDYLHKASSGLATVNVLALRTSVKVTASPASPSAGETVTLTATLKSSLPATGTVTFFDAGGKLCTAKVSDGKASCKYTWDTAGTYKVTAVYSGNPTHAKSKGTLSVTVAAPAAVTELLTI